MSGTEMISSRRASSKRFSDHDSKVLSEERLVADAKIGRAAAFDELCKRNAKKLFHITYRITRNHEDAEDAVQESFLRAFVHLKTFDGKSQFSTWLTRIAMNAALMKLRRDRALREVPIEEPLESGERWQQQRVTDSTLNPEERYAEQERETILREAVARLRPTIRKVVEIHQLQESSLGETAEVLGISLAAAKGRMFHARAALRKTSQLKFVVPSIWANSDLRSRTRAYFCEGSVTAP
jgi:RNA polymerase sigma factor (sigma-70 family)